MNQNRFRYKRPLMMQRTRVAISVALAAFTVLGGGCQRRQTDDEAVRAAIMQHLQSLKTLNMQSMDTQVSNISIQGNLARADAEFRPHSGAPSGAAMQVTYKLEKQSGVWSVTGTDTMGGAINHPAPGTNPHLPAMQSDPHALPDIHRLMQSLDQKKQSAPGNVPPSASSHP